MVWDRNNPPSGTQGIAVPMLCIDDLGNQYGVALYFDSLGRLDKVVELQCAQPYIDVVVDIRCVGGGALKVVKDRLYLPLGSRCVGTETVDKRCCKGDPGPGQPPTTQSSTTTQTTTDKWDRNNVGGSTQGVITRVLSPQVDWSTMSCSGGAPFISTLYFDSLGWLDKVVEESCPVIQFKVLLDVDCSTNKDYWKLTKATLEVPAGTDVITCWQDVQGCC